MDYELARQLKEAGFPLDYEDKKRWHILPSGDMLSQGAYLESHISVPVLSELIEAMPMRCKNLGTINDAHFVLRKLVSADKNQYWAYYEDEDIGVALKDYSFRNEPADVVVSKLWLALNKNK